MTQSVTETVKTLTLVTACGFARAAARTNGDSQEYCRLQACFRQRRLTQRSSGRAPASRVWPPFHSGSNPACLRAPLYANVRFTTVYKIVPLF